MLRHDSIFYYGQEKYKTVGRPNEGKRRFFRSKKCPIIKLSSKIKQLEISCGIFLDPVIRSTNIQEKASIRLLKSIVKNTESHILRSAQPETVLVLIQCSLVLMQAYVAHLKIRFSFWEKLKRRPFAKSVKYFHLLILKLIPEMTDMVIDAIMEFLKSERLWNVEFICCEILTSLLACRTPSAKILVKMLDFLEEELMSDNIKGARHVIRVLYKILNEELWCEQTSTDCARLIHLFYDSVSEKDITSPYFQMRRGFEMCLIRMCEVIQNHELMIMITVMFELCFGTHLLPEAINDFSHPLELAIMYADVETITKTVEPKVLQYILVAIASNNAQKSRLASRLLARLFDRNRNFAEFITPRMFLPGRYYKIKISVYRPEDKDFFLQHRTQIEYHLLLALRQHHTASNLETVFTILCTMLAESPCGYTACQVISILLEFQDYALGINGNSSTTETNQMHAVVISVMMLIAWVHQASSLSLYVQRILHRRADNAPHLNPPIRQSYQYAQHHILWNEPSLFLDFWEIRYGMWKRFRSHEQQLLLQSAKITVQKYNNESIIRRSKNDRVQDEIIATHLVRESIETLL